MEEKHLPGDVAGEVRDVLAAGRPELAAFCEGLKFCVRQFGEGGMNAKEIEVEMGGHGTCPFVHVLERPLSAPRKGAAPVAAGAAVGVEQAHLAWR